MHKPGKPKGPVVNLRPISLLPIIRKLSKITLERIKTKIESYLSQSQAAYRSNRSTTYIIFAYRWIIAKVQEWDITIYITGIDMSAAFDTILRPKLIEILKSFLDDDETRIIQMLLSETSLETKMHGAKTESFPTNMGSPQGDGISGPLYTIYFERALRDLRAKMKEFNISDDNNYSYPMNTRSSLPDELIYADDTDFLTRKVEIQERTINAATETLTEYNLKVNATKTEYTTLKRGDRNTETWREVKKLGSMLGDREDIARRKQLACSAMRTMRKIWLSSHHKVSLQKQVKLCNSLVMSVLTYNASCWGLTINDENQLDSFHRQLLRKICNIHWPQRISCKNIYKRTKQKPLSTQIAKSRWKRFGHSLRMNINSPAQKAMEFYFEQESYSKLFSGGKRATIVTTIQRDINRTNARFPLIKLPTIESLQDLQNYRNLASDRKNWKRLSKAIVDTAQANISDRAHLLI